MRENVRAFVEIAAESFKLRGPVYEFGSFLVEGSSADANLRSVFPGQKFIGCDMRPGPGVDRIEDLSGLKLDDETVPTIICVDTLEHVFNAQQAVSEMLRVLAPGGVMLVAVPMHFRVHDYPADYWRFTPACIDRLLSPLAGTLVVWQGIENYPHTVLGVGCKAPVTAEFARGANQLIERFQQYLAQLEAARPWSEKLKDWTVGLTRGKGERRRRRETHRARFMLDLPVQRDKFTPHAKFTGGDSHLGSRINLS